MMFSYTVNTIPPLIYHMVRKKILENKERMMDLQLSVLALALFLSKIVVSLL